MSSVNEPLATYLHDHLAGAKYAIELVQAMRDEFEGKPLGTFAASILNEIKNDRDTLQHLAERVGSGSSQIKEVAAWLSEKVARLKMGPGAKDGLGTFEALEFLEIGIHGKWALWRALMAIAPSDPRLQDTDFEELSARAESQRSAVDQLRLEWAGMVFKIKEKSQITEF
jgi:hypothetical protein